MANEPEASATGFRSPSLTLPARLWGGTWASSTRRGGRGARWTARRSSAGSSAGRILPGAAARIKRWDDTRRLVAPGEPDRTNDLVAWLHFREKSKEKGILVRLGQVQADPGSGGRPGRSRAGTPVIRSVLLNLRPAATGAAGVGSGGTGPGQPGDTGDHQSCRGRPCRHTGRHRFAAFWAGNPAVGSANEPMTFVVTP